LDGFGPTARSDAGRAELEFRWIYSSTANFIEQAMETKRASESQFRARENELRSLKNSPLLCKSLAGDGDEY
jgi:hypothetical protein